MAIRDLGQDVSSVQGDQHLYIFINYNAEHAGAQGHAQFCFIHFFFILDCCFFFFVLRFYGQGCGVLVHILSPATDNQQQRENDHRNDFMIDLHESYVTMLEFQLQTCQIRFSIDCAIEPTYLELQVI